MLKKPVADTLYLLWKDERRKRVKKTSFKSYYENILRVTDLPDQLPANMKRRILESLRQFRMMRTANQDP